MLSATLGPGLLGMVYDGLQNPLKALAQRDGFFLVRGTSVAPLDLTQRWPFVPSRKAGERLRAGDSIGTVQERRFIHKIMLPSVSQARSSWPRSRAANSRSTNRWLASVTRRVGRVS